MNTQETNLEINWDEDDSQVAETVEAVVAAIDNDIQTIEKTKEKEIPAKTVVKEQPVVGEVEEVNWDDTDEGATTDDSDKDDTEKEKPTETSPIKIAVINTLKEKGFLNVEDYLEEGVTLEDLDEDELQELIDDGLEASQDASIEKVIKELPPIGKNFLKIVAKGGDGMAYLQSLADNDAELLDEELDIEEVGNQKKIMTLKLKKEGYDEDYIQTFIETLENSNKLKATSNTEFKKLLKEQKDNEVVEQERIDNISRQRREKENNDVKEMKDFIASKTDIQGVKLSKKEQQELPDYMFKNTVDVEGGRKITKFYHDLFTGFKNKENLTLIAKIVKAGFKLDDIKADLTTTTTKNVRQEIQRQESGKTRVKIKSSEGKAIHELI